jgi:hypothetical protein
MTEHTLITRGVGGALRLTGSADLPVTVLLRHSSEDPAAVRAVVLMDAVESFELLIERSLLTAGLTSPSEDGDVRVSIAGTHAVVAVGELTLLLALTDLVDLLLASYVAAPSGSEHDVVIALSATARQLSEADA